MTDSEAPASCCSASRAPARARRPTRLAEHYGVAHLSTGDMFRAAAAQGTAFGLEAKRYMDAGELVPDEIVDRRRRGALRAPAARSTTASSSTASRARCAQAEELDRVLDGHPLDVVINLDVPTEIVLDRIAGRRVCENCGAMYHVNMPPTTNWTCDACGGHVVQRDDDTEEAVDRRLELYEQRDRADHRLLPRASGSSSSSTASATATRCSSASSRRSTGASIPPGRDHPQERPPRSR